MGSCCSPKAGTGQPDVMSSVAPSMVSASSFSSSSAKRNPVVKSSWGVPCVDEFEVKLGDQWHRMPSHSDCDEQVMLLPQLPGFLHTSKAHHPVLEIATPSRARTGELQRSPSADPKKIYGIHPKNGVERHSSHVHVEKKLDHGPGRLPRARPVRVLSRPDSLPAQICDATVGSRLRDDETSLVSAKVKATHPLAPGRDPLALGRRCKKKFNPSLGGG